MSNTAIFVMGLFTFLLLVGGLAFTISDIRKSVRDYDRKLGR